MYYIVHTKIPKIFHFWNSKSHKAVCTVHLYQMVKGCFKSIFFQIFYTLGLLLPCAAANTDGSASRLTGNPWLKVPMPTKSHFGKTSP